MQFFQDKPAPYNDDKYLHEAPRYTPRKKYETFILPATG